MQTISRWSASPSLTSLQDQVNRLFGGAFSQGHTTEADLAAWGPAVDIYETEQELVVKADLPDMQEKDIDVRVENNTLSIRGERKFEKDVHQDNYLRVERAYGAFARTFTLPNTINTEALSADYHGGVLTVHLPKREESKPKQVKISVSGSGK
jgi:HSP20 family protein